MPEIDPYSNEIRHTLDLMMTWLQKAQPQRVRVLSHSSEMVKAVIRRIPPDQQMTVYVERADIQAAVAETLGRDTRVVASDGLSADVALLPLPTSEKHTALAGEQMVIAAYYNALSYKSLLYPGSVPASIFAQLAQLRAAYRVEAVAGLYPPRFIVWWTLTCLLARLDSARYFRTGDYAMRHLIEFGPWWRFCYVVVAIGHRLP
jgi:hypothetical protein